MTDKSYNTRRSNVEKALSLFLLSVFSFIKTNCSPGGNCFNAILEFHVTQKYNKRYLVKYNPSFFKK